MTQYVDVVRYAAYRLGVEAQCLTESGLFVAERHRRLRREIGSPYTVLFWHLSMDGGGTVVGVPPRCDDLAQRFISSVESCARALSDPEQTVRALNSRLAELGYPQIDVVFADVVLACHTPLVPDGVPTPSVECWQPGARDLAPGLSAPAYRYGSASAALCDNLVVALAFEKKTDYSFAQISDVSVTTAPGYRNRGCGSAVLRALTEALCAQGKQCWYACYPTNEASHP